MGTYITSADIKLPAALKTYLDGSASTIDDAILKTESEVNGYIAAQYNLPLSSVKITPLLKGICEDITIYRIYKDTSGTYPDSVLYAYQDAVRKLNDIAAGKVTLGIEEKEEEITKTPLSIVFKRG